MRSAKEWQQSLWDIVQLHIDEIRAIQRDAMEEIRWRCCSCASMGPSETSRCRACNIDLNKVIEAVERK